MKNSQSKKQFSFTAVTKSGGQLKLFYITDGKSEDIKIGVRNEKRDYEHPDAGKILPKGRIDYKKPLLYLNNKYTNKKLIGQKIEGYVHIPDFDETEFEKAKKQVEQAYYNRIDREIESLSDSDEVRLYFVITGYGKGYGLSHDKLSHEAAKRFERSVKMIDRLELAEFKSENPRGDYGGSTYSVTVSYAKYKELAEKAEKIVSDRESKKEADRQAKFDKARKTGKPVKLSSMFLQGADIPKKFRQPDSDMGTLYEMAMPDGSTKKRFSHAY